MTRNSWLVCSLLLFAAQLGKISSGATVNMIAILGVIITSLAGGALWALIAGWMRMKFGKNISDSYILKVQITFSVIGLLLIVLSLIRIFRV